MKLSPIGRTEQARTLQAPHRAVRYWLSAALLALLVASLAPAQVVRAQEPETPGAAENSLYLPVVRYQFKACQALKAKTMFGVQTYDVMGSGTPYYQSMIDSGAAWVRVETYWQAVEPQNTTPDQYNWDAIDALAGAVNDGCMNTVFTIESNPSWAASTTAGPIDRAPLSELAEYLGAVVERFDGDGFDDAPGTPEVHYFELYNEPDRGSLPNAPGWGDHGADYAAMLQAVYPAMKAADPQVKVLLGGIAYDNFIGEEPEGAFVKSFLTDVLNAGGGDYFDVMNFHYYPLFAARWTGSADGTKGIGFYEKTQAVRTVLQQAGLSKPFVVTEGGWHSNADQAPASSEAAQAIYAFQMYMQSYASGVDFTMWWTLYDIDYNFYPFKNGLVSSISESDPPRRKQSFTVYQTLASQIGPLSFVQKLPDAATGNSQIEAYHFTGARTVYGAWLNPILTTTTKTFSINASQVTERNMFWAVVKTIRDRDDGSTDGRVRVAVNGTPKYFEVNQ